MDIRISKESEVPIHEQVAAQIVVLIGTGEWKPGRVLPSVRELARRLKIHHNTVSRAYQDLVLQKLVARRRGIPLVVSSPDQPECLPDVKDLDDLINETIQAASKHGYTLQQLRQRVRERMLVQPPDHILVLSADSGMRVLLQMELKETLNYAVESCSPDELAANPGLAIGSLVLSAPGPMRAVVSVLPKDGSAIPIIYSPADQHVEMVRGLQRPSMIALVSISEYFLQTARGVLAPVAGQRHSIREYLLTREDHSDALGAADIVICDSVAYRVVRSQAKRGKVVPYRLIAPECVEHISSIMIDSVSDDAAGNDHQREKAQARNR